MSAPNGVGLALPWQTERLGPAFYANRVLRKLPSAFWINYLYDGLAHPRYVPMLWSVQRGAAHTAAASLAAADTERYWILGNEPDRTGPESSDTSPQEFVDALRAWPSRHVIVPGIDLSDGGLAWFREFVARWRARGSGISSRWIWGIHCYPGDAADLVARWGKWRRVMEELRCHRPTIFTEFASYRADAPSQAVVLGAGVELMQRDRWLAGLAWFSAHYGSIKAEWSRSDLLDAQGGKTALGSVYANVSTSALDA